MLTRLQQVKETVLLTILNVALPTVDIFTDLNSISKLYIGTLTHPHCDDYNELWPFAKERVCSQNPDNTCCTTDGTSNTLTFNTASCIDWSRDKITCMDLYRTSEGSYNSHPIFATFLLVPFLINYLVTWSIWWNVDKRKTTSWIAPLLSVYPQVRRRQSSQSTI